MLNSLVKLQSAPWPCAWPPLFILYITCTGDNSIDLAAILVIVGYRVKWPKVKVLVLSRLAHWIDFATLNVYKPNLDKLY